jgi:hypothetical protein
MALVLFFAGAWGYARLAGIAVPAGQGTALPAGGGSLLGNGGALLALAALIGTAALAGLLLVDRRRSPLATGLPGALLLAWTGLYLVNVRQAVSLIPLRSHPFGAGWEALLIHGLLGAAGAMLIVPALIPARWRASQAAGTDVPPVPAAEPLPAVWPDARSLPQEAQPPLAPMPGDEVPLGQVPANQVAADEFALTGTVLSYPPGGAVQPVDTSRVTGASRALRATGSFQAVPGSTPRSSGSLGTVQDGLRGPYHQPPEEE